jgi:hypothetical protein
VVRVLAAGQPTMGLAGRDALDAGRTRCKADS